MVAGLPPARLQGRVREQPGVWSMVSGTFPQFATVDGCITFSHSQTAPTDYKITFQSQGDFLTGNNTLLVSNSSGTPSSYEMIVTLSTVTSPQDVFRTTESILPRLYAMYAYMIESGYRGNYNDEELHVWWAEDTDTPANCCLNCANVISGVGHICIADSADQLKYVLGHEYGHINLALSSSITWTNDCTYDGDTLGNHHMRSAEWDSCAAHEGWAHFVSADMWTGGNIHSGGNPSGWMRYPFFGNPVIDFSDNDFSTGCMANANDSTGGRYIVQYADTCWDPADATPWDDDSNCSGGDCTDIGAELDWARTWWMYHTRSTGTGFSGTIPDHVDLQVDIDQSGGWGSSNAWTSMLAGLTGTDDTRFNAAADVAGASE